MQRHYALKLPLIILLFLLAFPAASKQQNTDKAKEDKYGISEEKRKELDKEYEYLEFSSSMEDYQTRRATRVEAPTQEVGFVGVGDSEYDKEISSLTQLGDLNKTRNELQPWYHKPFATISFIVVIFILVFFTVRSILRQGSKQ